MNKIMPITILLITGTSCVGKSYLKEELRKTLQNEKVKLHDFDEKQGDLMDVMNHFLRLAEEYNKKGYTLVLCGGILPEHLKSASSFSEENYVIHACLLTVDSREHRRRLLDRTIKFFSITNPNNLSVEDWISRYLEVAESCKESVKIANSWTVIDNTVLNSKETIRKVWEWIRTKI